MTKARPKVNRSSDDMAVPVDAAQPITLDGHADQPPTSSGANTSPGQKPSRRLISKPKKAPSM